MAKSTCSIDNCAEWVVAWKLCNMHYKRWRKTGAVQAATPPRMIHDEDTRFWNSLVEGELPANCPELGNCWLWRKKLDRRGYGLFSVSGRWFAAHRWAYEKLTAAIPVGLELDHLCRVPACVNPWHLEPVTHVVNVQRGDAAEAAKRRSQAQTHCKNGHLFDEENTGRQPNGGRRCRACDREKSRRYKAKQRGTLDVIATLSSANAA